VTLSAEDVLDDDGDPILVLSLVHPDLVKLISRLETVIPRTRNPLLGVAGENLLMNSHHSSSYDIRGIPS
jgi:hypothetical protein